MSEHWACQIATHILNRLRLKEIWKHGEAGSVDIEDVKQEQVHMKELLARFWPEDCWNTDKSALFTFAPPDHGLLQKQISGKHANKFCITLCFACNMDGSQKQES